MNASWFKSTFSSDVQTCVEISHRPDTVLIRDSKYTGPAAEQPILCVSATLWPTFLQLALSKQPGHLSDDITIGVQPDGGATITGPGIALIYTPAEWDAFTKGIADSQFDRPSGQPSY